MNNKRVYQSGKGIGGIFRSFLNLLLPVFKKAAPIIKSVATSAPVKKGLKKIGKKAVKSAINSASDLIDGRNPKNRLKKDLVKIANITSDTVSNSILNNNKPKKVKKKLKKKKKVNTSVYFGHGTKNKKIKKIKKISVYDY